MPPSVITPSKSKPTKRMDIASFGSITGAARALPRTLHAMRRVEDHGHVAGLAHSAKAAHVDDQITVAEECPALGDGDFVRRSAFAIELRVTATALHFFHGAAHPFRVHPLPLLHVHGAARGAGGEEEVC